MCLSKLMKNKKMFFSYSTHIYVHKRSNINDSELYWAQLIARIKDYQSKSCSIDISHVHMLT